MIGTAIAAFTGEVIVYFFRFSSLFIFRVMLNNFSVVVAVSLIKKS
ncbi:MAG: hypothetical protein KKA79_09305 [Nanoarchaeota archaeon]|nr:hypothetical protein [Nanoarchaeota archaeon]MCG2717739.1 hypothetical protein [Nanoarchaeota archaeon]